MTGVMEENKGSSNLDLLLSLMDEDDDDDDSEEEISPLATDLKKGKENNNKNSDDSDHLVKGVSVGSTTTSNLSSIAKKAAGAQCGKSKAPEKKKTDAAVNNSMDSVKKSVTVSGTAAFVSNYGKQNEVKRVAHKPSSGNVSEAKLQKSMNPDFDTEKARMRKEESEGFSGLKIKNRKVSSARMSTMMANRTNLSLDKVGRRSIGDKEEFVVIGVLVSRIVKATKNNDPFTLWRISNLGDTTLSVNLFSAAHKEWTHESIGSILAFLNPNVSEFKGRHSMSTREPACIIKLGTSASLKFCPYTKTNGEKCNQPIDGASTPFCLPHCSTKQLKTSNSSAKPSSNRQGYGSVGGSSGRGAAKSLSQAIVAKSGDQSKKQTDVLSSGKSGITSLTKEEYRKIRSKRGSFNTGAGAPYVSSDKVPQSRTFMKDKYSDKKSVVSAFLSSSPKMRQSNKKPAASRKLKQDEKCLKELGKAFKSKEMGFLLSQSHCGKKNLISSVMEVKKDLVPQKFLEEKEAKSHSKSVVRGLGYDPSAGLEFEGGDKFEETHVERLVDVVREQADKVPLLGRGLSNNAELVIGDDIVVDQTSKRESFVPKRKRVLGLPSDDDSTPQRSPKTEAQKRKESGLQKIMGEKKRRISSLLADDSDDDSGHKGSLRAKHHSGMSDLQSLYLRQDKKRVEMKQQRSKTKEDMNSEMREDKIQSHTKKNQSSAESERMKEAKMTQRLLKKNVNVRSSGFGPIPARDPNNTKSKVNEKRANAIVERANQSIAERKKLQEEKIEQKVRKKQQSLKTSGSGDVWIAEGGKSGTGEEKVTAVSATSMNGLHAGAKRKLNGLHKAVEDEDAKYATSGIAAALKLTMGELKSAGKEESANLSTLKQVEHAKVQEELKVLEAKDAVATQLSKVFEKSITAFYCKQCQIYMDHKAEYCQKQGHGLTASKGTKYYFECVQCSMRIQTVNVKHPKKRCEACKTCNWRPRPIYKEPKKVAGEEEFLLRGEEHGKFLNS
eukprot:Nk52_evm46s2118 gene=Nk52_evmTU46s2118